MTEQFLSRQKMFSCRLTASTAFFFFTLSFVPWPVWGKPANYGMEVSEPTAPYLHMPLRADGSMPKLLSQTGAFKNTALLAPAGALIPYDLIVPFWSDGAAKSRWVAVPENQKIKFAPTGEWVFPRGTVFVKTFSLATNETNPNLKRRLETRLLVCDSSGG